MDKWFRPTVMMPAPALVNPAETHRAINPKRPSLLQCSWGDYGALLPQFDRHDATSVFATTTDRVAGIPVEVSLWLPDGIGVLRYSDGTYDLIDFRPKEAQGGDS